jgi:hypothetical protein
MQFVPRSIPKYCAVPFRYPGASRKPKPKPEPPKPATARFTPQQAACSPISSTAMQFAPRSIPKYCSVPFWYPGASRKPKPKPKTPKTSDSQVHPTASSVLSHQLNINAIRPSLRPEVLRRPILGLELQLCRRSRKIKQGSDLNALLPGLYPRVTLRPRLT